MPTDGDGYRTNKRHAIPVVEYHMLEKKKYFPLSALSGLAVRTVLYPLTVIKTRLQLQKHNSLYSGTFDAFRRIVCSEGLRGLYSGFLVHNLAVASQMTFLTSYEITRHLLASQEICRNSRYRSFIAGGVASLVAQTVVVPVDVISQHLQILPVSNQLRSFHSTVKTVFVRPSVAPLDGVVDRISPAKAIVSEIYKHEGVRGFYKGYFTSVITYVPTSGIWWLSYDFYCDTLSELAPASLPRLSLQCMSALLSAVSTTILTTPMDAIRARIQVENEQFLVTAQTLWREERLRIFAKGLSPRLISSTISSFFVILCYETIKRWSLLDEYKSSVRW